MESDVSFDVTQKIADDLAKALRGKKVARSQDIEEIVRETLKKSINEVMTKNYRKFDLIDEIKKIPKTLRHSLLRRERSREDDDDS